MVLEHLQNQITLNKHLCCVLGFSSNKKKAMQISDLKKSTMRIINDKRN